MLVSLGTHHPLLSYALSIMFELTQAQYKELVYILSKLKNQMRYLKAVGVNRMTNVDRDTCVDQVTIMEYILDNLTITNKDL